MNKRNLIYGLISGFFELCEGGCNFVRCFIPLLVFITFFYVSAIYQGRPLSDVNIILVILLMGGISQYFNLPKLFNDLRKKK